MLEWKTSNSLVDYEEATKFMENRVSAIQESGADDCIWLLEHPPLYTAGTSAKADDLLETDRFPVYATGRGGQYTYHGPGMRIAYTMLNLKQIFAPNVPDIRRYVYLLEQWIIDTLAELGVKGERREGRVGIWVVLENGTEAKIAALGIRVRKWVSFHGIAINVNPDLSHFTGIVPCGIQQHGVTSLHALGIDCSMEQLDALLKQQFTRVFDNPSLQAA